MEIRDTFYFADLKKFDMEHNGFEFDSSISRGIFIKEGDKFVNAFDPYDERSVYARSSHYGEYFGEVQYGTKVVLATGSGVDEYAWVLTGENVDTTWHNIENLVLYSDDYYIDRINVASKRMCETGDLHEKYRMYRILENDTLCLKRNENCRKLIK